MTGDLIGELRHAAAWVERQDGPAPEWDVLLDLAADRIAADRDRIYELSHSLRETTADLLDALGYVSPYFREKWQFDLTARHAQRIVEEHGAPT